MASIPLTARRTTLLRAATLAALALALALVLGAALAVNGSVAASEHGASDHPDDLALFDLDDDRGITRESGPDAHATAAALSERTFPDGADTAYVATRRAFPDGLAGGAAAAADDAPLLLTEPGSLPEVTGTELERLGVSEITLLGGTAAVSADVESELEGFGDVTRQGGVDRYETAAILAGGVDTDTVFIATGENFADATAGAAVAGAEGAPVLLTRTGSLPQSTSDALDGLDVSEIVVLGGTAAVSADVESELESFATVNRLGGADRYETARLVAERAGTGPIAYVATGQDFADALASAPAAVADDAPVLLTRTARAEAAARAGLSDRGAELIVVTGGTAAITDATAAGLLGAIADEVSILGDTHLHGQFGSDDGPNLARYNQLVLDRKAALQDAWFVGAGDEFAPSVFSSVFTADHMIDALNASSLDVTTFGNHDFDYGPTVLKDVVDRSEFTWVSANMREAGDLDQVFAGDEGAELFTTVDTGNVTLGITGLAPLRVQEVTTLVDDDNAAEQIDVDDALDEVVPMMEDAGADLIMVASHLCGTAALEIAEARDDVDYIAGDDCADILHDEPAIHGSTAVSLIGDEYDHLAEATYFVMNGDPVALGWTRHDLDETFPEDPEIRAIIDHWVGELDAELQEEIGTRLTEWDTRTASVRSGETGIANYIIDAMRAEHDTDVGVTNGGGIRTDTLYPANEPITLFEVFDILPFGNTVTVINIEGDALWDALEHGVSAVEEGSGQFPQVSGIEFTWDPDAQAREYDDDGNVTTEGERIVEVTVGGEDLDLDATYSLATNDFMMAGGDGYTMFDEAEVVVEAQHGPLMAEVVADAVRADGDVTAETDGRIPRVESPPRSWAVLATAHDPLDVTGRGARSAAAGPTAFRSCRTRPSPRPIPARMGGGQPNPSSW